MNVVGLLAWAVLLIGPLVVVWLQIRHMRTIGRKP